MAALERWELRNNNEILRTPWFDIQDNDYYLPHADKVQKYYVLNGKGGANIVAKTADRRVVVLKQYRPTLDRVTYDFPAGYVESGDENNIEAAKREFMEETGYISDEWYYTGRVDPMPNLARKTDYCFLALNIELTADQALDENEQVEIALLPEEEVERLMRENEFTCGVCLSSWLRAKMMEEELGR